VISRIRREEIAGTTEEERLENQLHSFVSAARGNWATTYVNKDTKIVESVAFQSARMQRLLAAGPQAVMVDCTFGTNKSKYTLFSFCVHDIFGK
jgi:hypothetical protein